MGKKVCHITSAHGRYDTRIFFKQCQSLAKNGYEVTLLVNDDKEDEVLEGVRITSTKYQPQNRIARFVNSRGKLLNKAMEINADIYQLHDPDLLPIGKKLIKANKKVIFDSHEDVPRQIKDKNWIPKAVRNVVSKSYELYERHVVKSFNAVISVTPHIVERFKKINPNAVMVTNYPVIDENNVVIRRPERAICFAGGVVEEYRHHNIIKAIEDIKDIKYILAGPVTNEYLSLLKELPAWHKVEYLGKYLIGQ